MLYGVLWPPHARRRVQFVIPGRFVVVLLDASHQAALRVAIQPDRYKVAWREEVAGFPRWLVFVTL